MVTKSSPSLPLLWINIGNSLSSKVLPLDGTISNGDFDCFRSSKLPRVTITEYINRIYKYAKCSDECLLVALIYIDRLLQKNSHLALTGLNIHR